MDWYKNTDCVCEKLFCDFHACSQRTYSDTFLENKVKGGTLFCPSTSLTTLIQVLIPQGVYICYGVHTDSHRGVYRADHSFSLPAVLVSTPLCHSVFSHVEHNSWQQFEAVDLEQYMEH